MKKKILLGLGACCMVCLILVAFTSSRNAADSMITVSGIVQSQDHESLSGASVDVDGDASLSQITNTKGSFSVTCRKGSTLRFSYSDDSGDIFQSQSKTYEESSSSEIITLPYSN